MFLAAVIQMNSTSDSERNWASAKELAARAARYGAVFAATPENTNFLGPHETKVECAEPLDGPTCERFSSLAKELSIYFLLGSFNEKSSAQDRCKNTSVLFGPDGDILAVYRKIHLFDASIDGKVHFRESDTVSPGGDPVAVETNLGKSAKKQGAKIGLSICYDLRFPELYRRLCDMGAEMIAVPSAFTLTTGKDHWETLLRARAIENQCYILAPAQVGSHDDKGLRQSWGHSMIVDPWGSVIARASDGPGIALAEIDPGMVGRIRKAMPVTEHRRL